MNPRFIEEMGWRMGEVYAAVTDRILINLARYFPFIDQEEPRELFEYQAVKLAQMGQVRKETIEIIAQSMKGGDQALAELLEDTIKESVEKVDKTLKDAVNKGFLPGQIMPDISPQMTRTFQMYYRQSADKMNLVNTVMLQSTEQAYRKTVADIVLKMEQTQGIMNISAGEVISGVSTMNEAVRNGVQRMVETGITGFIDNGGHHWSPEAYITMDIRTTLANTARSAVTEEMQRYGCDLFSVSWHDGARPLCYPWQGKVISESNWSGEVEDLDGEKVHVYALSETTYGEAAGLFGINCGHYKIPFIAGYSKARQPEQTEKENEKEYAESQQQRALERDLREKRRDLMVAKARKDTEEIKRQKLKVDDAEDKLNSFCDQTGRERRRSREYTPIKAEWPEE